MEPSLSKLSQEALDQITTHLVLPRHLSSLLLVEHERKLVGLVLDAMGDPNEISANKTVKMFQSFQKLHPLVNADAVAAELRNLQPGEMLALYVRRQNTCLTVYHTPTAASILTAEPKEYIVSTFPVLFDNKDVQDCESDLHVSIFFLHNPSSKSYIRIFPLSLPIHNNR